MKPRNARCQPVDNRAIMLFLREIRNSVVSVDHIYQKLENLKLLTLEFKVMKKTICRCHTFAHYSGSQLDFPVHIRQNSFNFDYSWIGWDEI